MQPGFVSILSARSEPRKSSSGKSSETSMTEIYLDIERNLRLDQMTAPELRAILKCKETVVRDFLIGSTGGAVVTWLAGGKLNIVSRLFFTGGNSMVCGYWYLKRSLNRHIDYFLSLDGTWLQREAAASMMRTFPNNPRIMDRLSRHFYAEKVYDDSSDIPKLRWRLRNVFGDHDGDFDAATDFPDSNSYKSGQTRVVMKEAKSVSKPSQRNTAEELIENPFECIFGPPAEIEQIHSSGGSKISRTGQANTSRKRYTHGHKRHHHRRHRKNHHEASEV